MKFKSFLSIVVAASLSLALSAAVKVGEKAPSFTLTDTHGKAHSLEDFAGKTVVLEWTNHGCPFVKKHYEPGNMQSLQQHAAENGVVWLTISSSAAGKQGHMSNADWNAAISEKGIKSAATLIDASGQVGRMYDARVTPHMYIIDEAGTLVYNGAIDSISSARSSDIDRATPYVKNAIDAIKAGNPIENATNRPYGCGIKYASN